MTREHNILRQGVARSGRAGSKLLASLAGWYRSQIVIDGAFDVTWILPVAMFKVFRNADFASGKF